VGGVQGSAGIVPTRVQGIIVKFQEVVHPSLDQKADNGQTAGSEKEITWTTTRMRD
jgi:hypothetical protein